MKPPRETFQSHVDQYHAARDTIDDIIRSNSPRIELNLKTVARDRIHVMHNLLSRWEKHCIKLGYPVSEVVDVDGILGPLSKAYFSYVRYAFYYRFANGLKQNIQFRKIISFEYYFYKARKVLELKPAARPVLPEMTLDQQLFHFSPLAHFFVYRLMAEITVKDFGPLSDSENLQKALRACPEILRSSLFQFAARLEETVCIQDSLRSFIEDPANPGLLQIIQIIEQAKNRRPTA